MYFNEIMKTIQQSVDEAFSKWGKEVVKEVIEVGVVLKAKDCILYFQERSMREHAECASLLYIEN
jgi:hypothetical protein